VNVSLVKDNFKPNKFYKPVGDTIVVSYKVKICVYLDKLSRKILLQLELDSSF